MRGLHFVLRTTAVTVCVLLLPGQSEAQDVAAFYKGRQINMYIGSAIVKRAIDALVYNPPEVAHA